MTLMKLKDPISYNSIKPANLLGKSSPSGKTHDWRTNHDIIFMM